MWEWWKATVVYQVLRRSFDGKAPRLCTCGKRAFDEGKPETYAEFAERELIARAERHRMSLERSGAD